MTWTKNWKYISWKWFTFNWSNPFKTMKQLKGIFIPLTCYFYHGRTIMSPLIFYEHSNGFEIQGSDVGWKDKFDTPRYEEKPFIMISFFGYCFLWYWELSPHLNHYIDEYWEQALWYLYYYNNIFYGKLDAPDIFKARESWPWTECSSFNDKSNVSTWKDELLTADIRNEIRNKS